MKQTIWITLALALSIELAHADKSPNALPGLYYHQIGTDEYKAGRYPLALDAFERSAHYGDKLSQFNLGVMHANGEGVPPDRARGWAWLELASERHYPQFRQAADALWPSLSENEQARAREILQELQADYADAVALKRADRRLRQEKNQMTGSRVGMVGALTVINANGTHIGSDYYSDNDWNLDTILENEAIIFDALANTRVELRDLELKESKTAPKDAD